ncbi:MAG: imidazole glycerol phosphate synthase subunit HisH [Opitutales bacterium]
MKVAIIDYSMGNLRSVHKAWQAIGTEATIIDSPALAKDADLLVFPGQGAMTETIKLLRRTGFDSLIKDWIAQDKPFFGICLGLQALFEYSEEGDSEALGIFKGSVKKMRLPREYKVPHMGWNNVSFKEDEALLKGIDKEKEQFYFVHSYYVDTPQEEIIFGQTQYSDVKFTSAIKKSNLMACQFHPEKSQAKGLLLFKNFVEYIKKSSSEF